MEDFNSLHELYRHILPALSARVEELNRKKIYTTEEDIFLRLSELKWRKATNLTISTMTKDIFNITKDELLGGTNKDGKEQKEEG